MKSPRMDRSTRDGAGALDRAPLMSRIRRLEGREWLWYSVKVFVGVRVALAVVAVLGVALLPDFSHVSGAVRGQIPLVPTPVSVPGWPAHPVTGGWHNLFTSWERLDALWFLRIAVGGYRTTDASGAFFPLYPLAIRLVSFVLFGHPLAAALLVSNGAFLAALIVLYRLTADEFDDGTARRAVLYAAVFPTALFFFAPYSESLYLLLVLLAFRAARGGRWATAGLAGALAALTRNVGVILVLPLAIEAVQQSRRGRRRVPYRALGWSLAPVAGLALYLGYWARRGDWLAPLRAQTHWDRQLTDPITTLGKGVNLAFRYVGVYPGGYHLLDLLIAGIVIAAGIYVAGRFRVSYAVYTWASILIPLASIFEGRPLIAFSRYALPIFPIYWAMARWTERRPVRHEVLVAGSAVLLGLATLLFVNWYYII